MLPFQPVEFSLAQLSQSDQKKSAARIIVLLASEQIRELSKWVGALPDREQSKDMIREGVDDAIFVIDPHPNPAKPFRAEILIKGSIE